MAESTENEHKSNNDSFTIDIPGDLESLWPKDCCIYRIPKNLRDLNEAAYTPQLVSIGPIHHKKPEKAAEELPQQLANMEKYKYIYLKKFLKRSNKELEEFVSFIKGRREEEIRRCYSEPFLNVDSNEYVRMFLLDAFFIFELFIRDQDKDNKEYENDCLLHKSWMKDGVLHDLILLENQLPYSHLVDLYDFGLNQYQPRRKFFALTNAYFSVYNREKIVLQEQDILHFTDLVRRLVSQKPIDTKKGGRILNLRGAAKKLSEAGIKFEKIKYGKLTDVSFDKKAGILKLPHFEVYDTTESVVRNLMALEQCQYQGEAYICSYVLLVDFLINTNKDVALLVEKGLITNGLGSSKAVADMVNSLCRNIVGAEFYFQDICNDLNEYFDSRLHRCVAALNGEYFKNVWHGTGTVVGIILLLLSFTQSVWAVMRIINAIIN